MSICTETEREKTMNNNKTFTYQEALDASIKYFKGDELAAKVFVDKYALRNGNMDLVELTPDYMHKRIAKEFARIEKKKFKSPLSEDEIYDLLKNFDRIVPQGSPMYGIGNRYQFISLSNCYVVESPLDAYGSIMEADENLVQISKRRGGVGIDISHLRPSGAPTKNAARTSTGVVSFAERYSNSIREVGQAGRRGALMVTLNVHHPDILEFAKVKRDLTKVTGANISIRLTDEFLKAVDNNEDYEQRWPIDSSSPTISRKVNARSIWNIIVENAHHMAEPGLLFWDNIIKESPADCYASDGFETISTNPCCFAVDKDVWVVTKSGIKEIKSLTSEDLVFINETSEWASTSGYFNAGKAEVFDVELSDGTTLHITENHKLCKIDSERVGTKMVRSEGSLVPLRDLKVGDMVAAHTESVPDLDLTDRGTEEEGLVMGLLTGDGCLSYHDDRQNYPATILSFWQHEYDAADTALAAMTKLGYSLTLVENSVNGVKSIRSTKFTENFTNKYRCNIWEFKSEDKPNPFLFNCSLNFIKGFLAGYFTTDGALTCNHEAKSYNIQLASINKARLEQVQQLLLLFGIRSSIGLMREAGESTFKGKTYVTKDCWRITITGVHNIMRFRENIELITVNKQDKLDSICEKYEGHRVPKCSNYAKIVSITSGGIKDVGCIEVPRWNKFTANGIISGNSEIPLSKFDSCRLMLLNAFGYVENPFTKKARFNFEKFNNDAEICQRLMDNLVDLEIECIERIIEKISSDPEPKETKNREVELWKKIKGAALNGRRTGTGATAIGDALAALGLPYTSEDGIAMTENIYKNLKLSAYRSSVKMAKEIGSFLVWDWNKEKDNPFLNRIKDEDSVLYNDMKKHGRRNIALLTTAPAGSVSILTQTSSGIEPQFMIDPYIRRKKGNPGDVGFRSDFVDQNGDHWMEFKIYPPKVKMWMEITGETDLKKSPWNGSTAPELDWRKRVNLQSVAQRHLDHAISSTINLPNDVSVSSVDEIYRTAWKSGCKGITIYRDGCRTGVLVSESKKNQEDEILITKAPKRPETLPCDVHHCIVKGKQYFVIVGKMKEKPYEVFASMNHISDSNHDLLISKSFTSGTLTKESRGHYRADLNDSNENSMKIKKIGDRLTEEEAALTRIISTALRHGADVQFIVHQLEKVEGSMHGFSKSIARALKKYIPDGAEVSGETCSTCDTKDKCALIRQEGCIICKSCGWSKCG